jgi:hypothetical protein
MSRKGALGKRRVDSVESDVWFRNPHNEKRRIQETPPRDSQDLTFLQCLDTSLRARTRNDTKSAREHLRLALKFSVNRKVFVTHSGHWGIGSVSLQDDDVLAVSDISQWPFILRRAGSGDWNIYNVVGSAYIERMEEAMPSHTEIGFMHLV